MTFQKGHGVFPGAEKGWFKKGSIPWSRSQKGVTLNTGRTHFKKGQQSHNKGKSLPKEEKAAHWMGDEVGYGGLHQWLYRKYGKANHCEFDIVGHVNRKYEWSNKSGEYKRDITDWPQLCLECHRAYDNWSKKMWTTRRANEA